MSVYSVNQARHLFVIASASDYSVGKDAEGGVFLKVKNADGEMIRTDLITNILNTSSTRAGDMARSLNAVAITADADPVVGTTYTLGITYRQWVADSDEVLYHEWASAKATTTAKSDLYKALALNLVKNVAKQGLVGVALYTKSGDQSLTTEVTTSTKASDLTGTYTELHIIEKEQPWKLGVMPQTIVALDENAIICSWGTATAYTPVDSDDNPITIGNGKTIADLEYFCLGERGDQYRNIGWPYVTPTEGVADATKTYDVVDIHYAYTGANEGVQKSEKTITLAVQNSSSTYSSNSLVNAVISAINTATGATSTSPAYIKALATKS